MSFEFRVIQEFFPTTLDFANVHSFSMSHLMLPIRSYISQFAFISTLIKEHLLAVIILTNIFFRIGFYIESISHLWSKVIQGLMGHFFLSDMSLQDRGIDLLNKFIHISFLENC